jgi:hypothetical protein
MSAGLSDNSSGVVAANIEEGAQNAVIAANYDYRLTRDRSGDELAGGFQLIGARDELPGFAEYRYTLEVGNPRINVPGRGNGGGLRKRGAIVVTRKNLFDGRWHGGRIPRSILAGIGGSEKFAANETGQALRSLPGSVSINSTRSD